MNRLPFAGPFRSNLEGIFGYLMEPIVLVTGGAGFIGTHLVRALSGRQREIVVLDDLSAGHVDGLPTGTRVIQHDISDPSTPDVVARISPAIVIHAAAQVSVARSMGDPQRDLEVNVIGTRHVVDGARSAGTRRLVFLSSGGAIYGETDDATEDDPPRPASYYGVHKWVAERYVMLSGVSHGIARLANVYGPEQRADLEGGVAAIFAQALATDRELTIHGDGRQRRDFIHVDDVARAIALMVESRRDGVWNVGTGLGTSVVDLLGTMERVAGRSAQRRFGPARLGDIRSSTLRVDRIRNELGWHPRVGLETGLATVLPGQPAPKHP